jgi:murein DD-endopeptidase MepM/ murein hydrolase activator NlpD
MKKDKFNKRLIIISGIALVIIIVLVIFLLSRQRNFQADTQPVTVKNTVSVNQGDQVLSTSSSSFQIEESGTTTGWPEGFSYPTSYTWQGTGDTQQPPGKSNIFGWLITDQDNPPYPVHNSHRGIDIYAASNAPVFSITSGVVAENDTAQSDYLNKNLWIKHDKPDGGYFYTVYGHVNSSLSKGVAIKAGQQIATIASQNNPHIHLGIHPSGVSYPWGRGAIPSGWSINNDPDKSELPLDGWVAPRTYIENLGQ